MRDPRVNRRELLKLTSVGVGGVLIGTNPVSAQADEQAPSPEEYDDILMEMDGDGSMSEPYTVTDVTELQAIDGNIQANYILGNDIDASSTDSWNDGEGFKPIAASSGDFNRGAFEGTLTGNGHSINKLTINRPSEDRTALFSGIDTSTVVMDILLSNAEISGRVRTGGIAGESWGTIKQSGIIDSNIQGTERVGGITANANGRQGSSITDVFSVNTEISGDDRLGGIVGRDWYGEVKNSFSTERGIIGYSTSSTTESVYYENGSASSIGVQLTRKEMQGDSAAEAMDGFDFDSVWETVEDGYPILRSLVTENIELAQEPGSESESESGSESESDDQTGDNGDTHVTVPGFGMLSAVAGLGGAGYVLKRRFSNTETISN